MLVLGIETSCDETGVALYDSGLGLLAHALHSQSAMHNEYGGVVPELASRDHIRRILPLVRQVLNEAGASSPEIDLIAYTKGPGLAGALLVGASFAQALAYALQKPAIGIHHLEGHLLSPLLSKPAPEFPFVALLVSGGHTQLMRVERVGGYALLGETLDDAAGEAFDKCAKLLGLPYPGGPALSRLAVRGERTRFKLPRPMLSAGSLDFSFSGLKTAVLTLARQTPLDQQTRCDLAAAVEDAIVDVLAAKSLAALKQTALNRLVVAGGVGANAQLRRRLASQCHDRGFELFFPEPELCTDNGAMIALAGALRYAAGLLREEPVGVRPRWNLEEGGLRNQAVGP
ncbi:MAG TPA: tRNA (adenosine(37)-N6)-threonylcarbamoyltransferase complex transferase subunit TsaD [Burkholderiales bacterium]|nr:tRNA (adenosine(37)-N6)-threonylcarbamoyltransferase complex transferase subunit TsaD [Burkholderiales bacterium]